MKITGLKVYVVDPSGQQAKFGRTWTFVQVETDGGLIGTGECTNYPGGGSLITGNTVHLLSEVLIGEDPGALNRIWHKVYRRFTYLGSRGLPTAAASAIDIALWDIQGQLLNRPVYQLLGGKVRDAVSLYANGWFGGCQTPEDYAAAAKRTVASGHTALKFDPFKEMRSYHTAYLEGRISAEGEEYGASLVAAVREAVGPKIEILIDAHGHYNVPTAVRLCKRLEPYKIGWFEEPLPPESTQALRSVREQVNVPICVGERLYTRFDFVPIFEQRLADFIMPDVCWTGGISELCRIAAMAEAYYVPISPHNALGPIQIVAGAHAMLTVPNFYRLEHSVGQIPKYQACLDRPIEFRDGHVHVSDRPGLGVALNLEFVRANLVASWET